MSNYYMVTLCYDIYEGACSALVESDAIDSLEEALKWAEARWDVSQETERWTDLPNGQAVRAVAYRDDDGYDLMVITEYERKGS